MGWGQTGKEAALWKVGFERGEENAADWGELFDGAQVVHEYGRAYRGEQFLLVKGLNSYDQYSMKSAPIRVEPGSNCELSFAYRFTPKVERYGINVYVFCLNAAGRRVDTAISGWARDEVGVFYAVHGPGAEEGNSNPGEWKVSRKELIIPEGICFIRFKLRHCCLRQDQEIGLDDFKLARAQPRISVPYRINSSTKTLTGRIDLLPTSLADHAIHYQIVLREYDEQANRRPVLLKDGKTYNTDFTVKSVGRTCRSLTLQKNSREFKLDLADLPDKGYVLSAQAVLDDGRIVGTHDTIEDSVLYVAQAPVWRGNQLGILSETDSPPPPWKPLKYDAEHRRVTTWNNRLEFGEDLGLKRVRYLQSRDESLVGGGGQLQINGKPAAELLSFDSPQLLSQKQHTIKLSARGVSADFNLTIHATIDFDGLIRYELQFEPQRSCTLNTLEIVLPLRDGLARFIHPSDYRKHVVLGGAHPAWQTEEFRPSVWIGNEQTGLVCCTDWDQSVGSSGPGARASLAENTWRLSFIPAAVKLAKGKSFTIVFALQPTPTRPRLDDFRDIVMRGEDARESNLELLWSLAEYFRYPGFPLSCDGAAEEWSRQIKSRPTSPWAMLYLSSAYHMTTIPEATWFADRWRVPGGHNAYANEMSGWEQWSGDMVPVNFNDPLWQDMFCYYLDRLLAQSAFDGLYFDVSGGGLGPDGNILKNREFHKRIYVILKRHRPNGITMFHSITNGAAPYVSFSDLLCRGEAYREQLYRHPYYMDFMSLSEFRCNIAATTGQGVMFLPQYRQLDDRASAKLACQTMGLILLHDMNVWPSWMNAQVIERVRSFQRAFGGLQNANFYPYWDPRRSLFLQVQQSSIAYSLFEKDTNLFAVLFNQSKETVHAQVRITPTVLDSHIAMGAERKAVVLDPASGDSKSYEQKQLLEQPIEFDIGPCQSQLLEFR